MSHARSNNKKWLISRLKTSGSKRQYVFSQSYGEGKNKLRNLKLEELPKFEGIGRSMKFYNGKINTSLLKRFLETQVGKPWEIVHDEIQLRIPTKLKEYNQVIYWYVADKIELIDDKVFDLREQQFINFESSFISGITHKDFIVNPQDHKLYTYRAFYEQLKAGLSTE